MSHSSWADVYDIVCEESFGDLYRRLTAATIEQVEACMPRGARIVDFGAATGRLAIPLASRGYEVVAVEPCEEMLDQLARKPGAGTVRTVVAPMEDFSTVEPFDMALCVFTVLSYLLDEESLEKSIRNAASVLRPGGRLLIDVPSRALFQSYRKRTSVVDRSVTITPKGGDRYLYEERTSVSSGGHTSSYTDEFSIRYWDADEVMTVLARHGFSIEDDLTDAMADTGSRYFLMTK